MIDCYAPGGTLIPLEEWAELFGRRTETMAPESWWRKHTELDDDVSVSTVWIGLDLGYGFGGPPLIWETLVFRGDEHDEMRRYASRAQALDDHERIVKELRAEVPR